MSSGYTEYVHKYNIRLTTQSTQNNNSKCNQKYSTCHCAQNVKSALEEYNKIIGRKNEQSEYELSIKIHELINIKLLNGHYSNTKLLNDFFHLKYNHHINDNMNEFNLFYEFLSNYDNVLACDIICCKGYKRYYRNREQILNKIKCGSNQDDDS
eukprot:365925_1